MSATLTVAMVKAPHGPAGHRLHTSCWDEKHLKKNRKQHGAAASCSVCIPHQSGQNDLEGYVMKQRLFLGLNRQKQLIFQPVGLCRKVLLQIVFSKKNLSFS